MASKYIISPRGELRYPWLNKPDTKFNDDGIYKTDLVLDDSSAEKLKDTITRAAEAALAKHVEDLPPAKAKKFEVYLPFEEELDEDSGEPTGSTIFKFRQNAVIRLKDGDTKDIKIELRDSKDNVMDKAVWDGSEGRIMFSMRTIVIASTSKVGVRLDFYKVQIAKMASGTGSKGFGAIDDDDGYVADASDISMGDMNEEGDY